jgi:hypothetical protein
MENIIINIGDFVYSNRSQHPSLVINKNTHQNQYLIAIDEYNGDYIWISHENIDPVFLASEKKLSILANFGNWFYDQHKELYQEIIIENLQNIYNTK